MLVGALLSFRIASAFVVFQPGYTDAYYYADVAKRLAAGQGLTADFIWNFLEAAPGSCVGCIARSGEVLVDVPSHQFWMPLATVLQAIGIKLLPFVDAFHAAQSIEILLACAIPIVTYAAARSLGGSVNLALVAAALAGLGGLFAPAWVSLDAFVPAALIGTAFFLLYRRAAVGDSRAGALAGLAVGLLFLARAEGALFGLALLALLRAPATRRAGIVGSAVAVVIGLAWLARDLSLHSQSDLLQRTIGLPSYESFFAISPRGSASIDTIIADRLSALATNAVTFAFAFGLLLLPGLIIAMRARRHRPDVRAFAALALVVYLVECLLFTLHSTRGSYFHSLAAFFPFGMALGVMSTAELLRTAERQRLAAAASVVALAVVSVFALAQWDASFNSPYRERLAVVSRIPPGLFMAIDAAAWRWIADRPVTVTPVETRFGDLCVLRNAHVGSMVLEPVHFSTYDAIYRGEPSDLVNGGPDVVGGIKIYYLSERGIESRCDVR